ncbi:MAG TPA: flagellar hook-associated protein FlgL [Verrucomicrobiae bacterium]|jgi:flagellar hook-associated protein 3 FlgL|nr:flagellar hook-associated protein FlgL [Verrucomicrobiae bacterium]
MNSGATGNFAMRINPNPLPDLLAALEQTQQQINTDMQEISTGQTVNSPSDNPAAAAMLVQNANQTSQTDQYLRSVESIQGEMQNADSTLSSVVTALQRAISIGTEGANGTENATDRQAITVEVQGIQSQLVNLANLSYQGSYVFAGTATQTAPYVLDATSPSGVKYVGNSNTDQIAVGDNLTVQTNLPGSELFSSPGNDVFQALQDLITSLESGTGISSAVTEISNAYDYIDSQRVFYGNAMDQLNSQQTYLNSETTQLAQQQTNLSGTNLPASITSLESSETAEQATLETISQTQQNNLFSYLK